MRIRAVIFDLDNTLYSYDDAHAAAFEALAEYARRTLGTDTASFRVLHREAMDEQIRRTGAVCAAIHNRIIRFQLILERLGRPAALAPEMAERYWTAFLDAVRPGPGLEECLSWLETAGIRVGVGTNMTADYQYAKLQRLGILQRLNFFVSSEEVNAEKPDRKLFDCCAWKAGCPAGECVFVGDNPVHDVRGARDAGMFPVWLCADPDAQIEGVPRVRSLAELPALLRTLEE